MMTQRLNKGTHPIADPVEFCAVALTRHSQDPFAEGAAEAAKCLASLRADQSAFFRWYYALDDVNESGITSWALYHLNIPPVNAATGTGNVFWMRKAIRQVRSGLPPYEAPPHYSAAVVRLIHETSHEVATAVRAYFAMRGLT
jgi:hypothetical protein